MPKGIGYPKASHNPNNNEKVTKKKAKAPTTGTKLIDWMNYRRKKMTAGEPFVSLADFRQGKR